MSADLFQAVVDDVVAAMEGETFDDREDRHLSWTPLMLDEQAWASLQKLLDDTLKQVLKLNAEAAKRLAKSKEGGDLRVGLDARLRGARHGGEEAAEAESQSVRQKSQSQRQSEGQAEVVEPRLALPAIQSP